MDPEPSSASPEAGGGDSLAIHCEGSLQITEGGDCPYIKSESQPEQSPLTGSLDEFLVSALKSRQERLFLLKLDREFCNFIENPSQDVLEFPWLNSYYRMMIHRSAVYFQLARKVDPLLKRITLSKTEDSAIPPLRFCDLVEEEHGEPLFKPVKVLKRCSSRPGSVGETRCNAPGLERRSGSIEQREKAYAEARARIFQEHASDGSNVSRASTAGSDRVMASTEDQCEMRLIEERTSALELSTGTAKRKSGLMRRTSTSSTASSSGTAVTNGDYASSTSSSSGAGYQSPEQES
ncbi:R3H domain-containing protein 1, partial [Mortierella alpina]